MIVCFLKLKATDNNENKTFNDLEKIQLNKIIITPIYIPLVMLNSLCEF